MIELILAFFLSLFPHHINPTTTDNNNGTQITTFDNSDDDTGGETGHIPIKPKP